MGATIRFTWCLEPEVGVDLGVTGISSWEASNACSTSVAPVGAVLSHVSNTIAACVDDDVWIPAGSSKLLREKLYVVELRVASVPLAFELAWVFTA